jgi:hypothetical protein
MEPPIRSLFIPGSAICDSLRIAWVALFCSFGCLVLVLLGYSLFWVYIHATARTVATDFSPDGKYRAVLYAYPPILRTVSMPGDGGGSWDDGFAVVYDTSGKVVCEVLVPAAGQGFQRGDGNIFWYLNQDHKVYIKGASCSLP